MYPPLGAGYRYAMGGIHARVFASRYRPAPPDEATLRREVLATQAPAGRAAPGERSASGGEEDGGPSRAWEP